MPQFDRIDGVFTTRLPDGKSGCTFDERLIFKRNGWVFDKTTKGWTTANEDKARDLGEYALGAARDFLENAEALAQAVVAASWAEDTDADFPAPEGLTYMPFQRAGIEYCVQRHKTLIADPPGLGKTIQAIGVHNVISAKTALVVCPASLKINWKREWEKWDVHGRTVGIAESVTKREHIIGEDGEKLRDEKGRLVYKVTTEHYWPDTDVVIINYDMLDPFDDKIKAKTWDLLVCDECHLLKTADALRTQCVLGGHRPAKRKNGKKIRDAKTYEAIEAVRMLFLTGTPILSRPIELWNLIRACDPKGLGESWEAYAYTYCGAEDGYFGVDASGATNLEELSRILRERFMIRRDKRAVLKELPDKTREPIILPQDKLEAPVKREKNRVEAALSQYEALLGISDDDNPFRYIKMMEGLSDRIAEALALQDSETPDMDLAVKTLSAPDQLLFTEMSAAREEVALAKVGMVADHIIKLVNSDEPVIAFAYHKSVIDELRKRLEKQGLRVAVITGSVSTKKRQAAVDGFQAGDYDVILGNILAMGVGWTLTRARFVVFAELDWVPALMEQAEDRAWRHGQINAVIAQYLLVDGSIEAYMAMAILEKMEIILRALDS